MGKTRVIAETGAGQHGVATATACALLGLECVIYMGAVDTARQALNVARMRLLGADVVSVTSGSQTLKDAINEAFRDWVTNADRTYYCFGTAAGPSSVSDDGPRLSTRDRSGDPRSNPRAGRAGYPTLSPPVSAADRMPSASSTPSSTIRVCDWWVSRLRATESRREGTQRHSAEARRAHFRGRSPISCRTRMARPSKATRSQQDWTIPAWARSMRCSKTPVAPSTGPITDTEAMDAFRLLCRTEGIIPAIESAHAVAGTLPLAVEIGRGGIIVVNLSGRGDKDVATAAKWFGLLDDEDAARG